MSGVAQTAESVFEPAHHFDTGCVPASHHLGQQSYCLSCPFNACLEDKRKGGPQGTHASTRQRDKDMRAAKESEQSVSQIAELFGVSYSIVWRALRRRDRG